MNEVRTGLDVLLERGPDALTDDRIGLLAHPASVDRSWRHAVPSLQELLGDRLRVLFGPQHGLRGETQDNMIEWEGYRDPCSGRPVHSLYGEHRRPTVAMLEDLDTLVVDLQDVGARYYTFVWTLLNCLEACADTGKRVVVLDRPNPIGGAMEGNLLDPSFRSFVGMAPIPMRHGATLGELASWLRRWAGLDLDLEVIEMQGWRRAMLHDETGLPWVMPSPNMPTLTTALVYPGACLLEGTTLSEGRGTTRPFEIVGAPGLDSEALADALSRHDLPGLVVRPLHFLPTFQKHAGELCGGVQMHVTDRAAFQPVRTCVTLLAEVRRIDPGRTLWRRPPYEYEHEKLPIDILAGGTELREMVDDGGDPGALVDRWDGTLAGFAADLAGDLRYA